LLAEAVHGGIVGRWELNVDFGAAPGKGMNHEGKA
jgi:hypothetical protein